MMKEFFHFIQKYGVIGLAVAVVIGGKINAFVSATVTDLIMPVIGLISPNGDWHAWELSLGSLRLNIGHWIGATIDLIIVAYIVFLFTKLILRQEEASS